MTLLDDLVFWYDGEDDLPETAEEFSIHDLSIFSSGVTFASANKTAEASYENLEEDPFQNPCLIVTKQDAFDRINQFKRDALARRFRYHSLNFTWADKKGIPATIYL